MLRIAVRVKIWRHMFFNKFYVNKSTTSFRLSDGENLNTVYSNGQFTNMYFEQELISVENIMCGDYRFCRSTLELLSVRNESFCCSFINKNICR